MVVSCISFRGVSVNEFTHTHGSRKTASGLGRSFSRWQETETGVSFNYAENTSSPNVSGRTTDKRGNSCATQRMLQEQDRQISAEEAASAEPPAWKEVYALMRCPGSCELGPHCWQDPYGKKHYKLYPDQLESLVKYVQSGRILQPHEDVPGMIRERLYRAEGQRLDRPRANNRSTAETSCPPITIINVLPTQALQAPGLSTSAPPEEITASSVDFPAIHISGLLDVAVREYSSWQQSCLGDGAFKADPPMRTYPVLKDSLFNCRYSSIDVFFAHSKDGHRPHRSFRLHK